MPVPLVRLPSLDLVRGFVAVGRRMSITLAAADLCLTQSAVSRQVQGLEEALGVRLLVRGHRSVAFTPEGERFFLRADSAVQQLQDIVGDIVFAAQRRPVTLTASIGVIGLWLLPRLAAFQRVQPDIEVHVAADNRLLDLRHEGIDLAIRYCPSAAAPAGASRLFGETIAPVASPAIGRKRLETAADLAAHYLLELDDARRRHLQWNHWLAALGWEGAPPRGVNRFNQYDQLMQAAIAGQGIALGRLELIGPLLAGGHLVVVEAPIPAMATDYAYWLATGDANPRADVRTVAAWIVDQARQTSRT